MQQTKTGDLCVYEPVQELSLQSLWEGESPSAPSLSGTPATPVPSVKVLNTKGREVLERNLHDYGHFQL